MRLKFFLLFCSISFLAKAQNHSADYSKADEVALSAPVSATTNIDSLAAYLTQSLTDDELKVRSIFRWVANNIAYDTKKQLDIIKNPSDISQTAIQVLKTRKAVCEGYSELVKSLCDRSGIVAIVVEGIASPQNARPLPHAWNAVKINNEWKLLDATWAAGGVEDKSNVFKKHFFEEWFFTPEKTMLVSHYPEDPIWQLAKEAINKKNFLEKTRTPFESNFSFTDTINQYLNWLETDTIQAFLNHNIRVLKYDPENSLAEANTKMLYNYLEYKKLEQANEKALKSTNDFNDIVSLVNMAKKKRKPKILNDKEAELLPRITGSKNDLTEVLSVYRKLNFTDNVNEPVVAQNIKQTEENIKMMTKMEEYLNHYFGTPVSKRLFVL